MIIDSQANATLYNVINLPAVGTSGMRVGAHGLWEGAETPVGAADPKGNVEGLTVSRGRSE